ncbi:hypothetical protein SPRG_18325 [Saprolegnia parasitica CBS 223.65]|uniref:HSF-type DNA-binding domain-containing protein n=1 Tax=Saprolegnia parasitica (strain CBS 223.65) TaxID=695850 RepID=A0A067BCR9_SAPPC|nr:hypothetical protein SPRG_18325 [Saprolegnia parasitica CBS 223.65]KDO16139.1 hypothetical protein SPRG_18325 [Saprolegnia parasitica CBS 223.65]|eukprot:XP_012213153.1 hypothetical protein SPRG_18325 [Saprolegnia parasitica CBS 223.65]
MNELKYTMPPLQFALHGGVPAPLPTPKAKVKASSPRSPIKKRNVGVPKFLRFLYEILEKEDQSVICWSHKGTAFQIRKPDALATSILPRYFKHNKVSSFQRQLNYFGFKKWTKTQTVVCTFSHPNFVQHRPDAIKLIKRKDRGVAETATTNSTPTSTSNNANSHHHNSRMLVDELPPPFPKSERRQQWAPHATYDLYMHGDLLHAQTNLRKHNVHLPHTPEVSSATSFSTEWGDVFLYGPPTVEPSHDAAAAGPSSSYFDLWDDDGSAASSTYMAQNTPVVHEMPAHLVMIKHDDMLLDASLDPTRFCHVAEF